MTLQDLSSKNVLIETHSDNITSSSKYSYIVTSNNPVFKCAYYCGRTPYCTHWVLNATSKICTLRHKEGPPIDVTDGEYYSGNRACSIGRQLTRRTFRHWLQISNCFIQIPIWRQLKFYFQNYLNYLNVTFRSWILAYLTL